MLIEITAPVGVLGLLGRRALPAGTGVEFEPTVSAFAAGSPALVVSGDDAAAVIRAIREGPSVGDVTVVSDAGDEAVLRLSWADTVPGLFERVRDVDGTVLSASARRDVWTLELRFADQDAASRFYTQYDDADHPITVRRTNLQETPHRLPQDTVTPEQREALSRAVEAGYFQVPRQTTLVELASELGISDTATSQRLRRGLLNVLRDRAYSSSDAVHPIQRNR